MNPATLHRLHALRERNDDTGVLMDALRPRFARLAERHTNGAAPTAVAAHQLFQTPAHLAARMTALLNPAPGARILEPSAGLGALLDALPPGHDVTAVEMAPQLAAVLYAQERPGMALWQRDFLLLSPLELGAFEAIIMNPPFTMKSDEKHVAHALRFLAPGGRLVALVMDTPHRERALRHLAATWEHIPAGTFRAAGTNVPTVLLSIEK